MALPPSGTIIVKKVDGNDDFVEEELSLDDIGGASQTDVDSIYRLFEGGVVDPFAVSVTASGGDPVVTVSSTTGGDLEMYMHDIINSVSSPQSVTISGHTGTDTDPERWWIHFPLTSGTPVLTATSNENDIVNESVEITRLLLGTCSGTDLTVYKQQNTTNEVEHHLRHLNDKQRLGNATWRNGVNPSVNITTVDGDLDQVDFNTAAGVVHQLHAQSFPAFSGSPTLYFVNHPTQAYKASTNLADDLLDSTGGDLSTRSFSVVVWGAANKSGTGYSKLFVNLPTGSYGSASTAIDDPSGYTVYSIPTEFVGVGFLIARVTLKHSNGNGGTIDLEQLDDLRGLKTDSIGGSLGASVTSSFVDNVFEVVDDGDPTSIMNFSVGGITAGQTRTYTAPDKSGILALLDDITIDNPMNNNESLDWTNSSGTEALPVLNMDGSNNVSLTAPSGSLTLDANGNVIFATHAVPQTSGSVNLGSESFPFGTIYLDTILSEGGPIWCTDTAANFAIGFESEVDGSRIEFRGSGASNARRLRLVVSDETMLEASTDEFTIRRKSDAFTTFGCYGKDSDSPHVRIKSDTGSDSNVVRIEALNTSYTDIIHYINCSTSASSAWDFGDYRSSATSDREFRFRGDGVGTCDGSWTGGGADYAEYFESVSETALTIGETVVLDGEKIRPYNPETDVPDDIIGVVRPKQGGSAMIGNLPMKWHNKYLRDDFGAYILDGDGHRQLNPGYDGEQEYVAREDRDEWNLVGLLGQVPVLKTATKNIHWKFMKEISATVDLYYLGH
jgi:hypothetical protein